MWARQLCGPLVFHEGVEVILSALSRSAAPLRYVHRATLPQPLLLKPSPTLQLLLAGVRTHTLYPARAPLSLGPLNHALATMDTDASREEGWGRGGAPTVGVDARLLHSLPFTSWLAAAHSISSCARTRRRSQISAAG